MEMFTFNSGIGHNILNLEVFDFTTPLFIGNEEFLPFMSVVGNTNVRQSLYRRNPGTQRIVGNSGIALSHITSVHRTSSLDSYNLSQYIDTLKRSILYFKNSNVATCIPSSTRSYSRTTYDEIINKFFSTSNISYFLQSLREIRVGAGMIYIYHSHKILMTLVVPRALITYQRTYFLLYGKFDFKGMEFWVDESLDTPSTPYKAFRKHYRARIKTKIIEYGIPIVSKNDITSLLTPKIEYPQSSIDELNSWKEELVKSCIQQLRTE